MAIHGIEEKSLRKIQRKRVSERYRGKESQNDTETEIRDGDRDRGKDALKAFPL